MRIAITGAAGFLGAHFIAGARARGAEIVPIVREVTRESPEGSVRASEVIASPSRALAGVDVLVHAAAIRNRHGFAGDVYVKSNVELADDLLRAASGRVRRFVFVSSVGVYGWPAPSALPVTERAPFAPTTVYSKTKVLAEERARELAPSLGLELVVVRPSIVYGPRDRDGMLDRLARMIAAGTYRVVGSGENTLHHAYVDDVVDGLWLASTEPRAAGEDFLLAGPETITLSRLSELVARALGKKVPRVHVPRAAAWLVARALDEATARGLAFRDRDPPLSREKLAVMTRSIAFDVSKARRVLGFAPKFTYDEGIRATFAGPR